MPVQELFKSKLKVINVGLSSFKENLDRTQTEAINVDWKPPLEVNSNARHIIEKNSKKIQEANQKALSFILNAKPFLTGMGIASEQIPGMKQNLILHSGPPIEWSKMCGPTRGAIIGALIYEGMASSPKEAENLAASEEIEYAPCHEHATVGPMAGIVSPSMPVFIIKNQENGNKAYCTMNEGLGKVLRYGAFSDDVIQKLKWMDQILYPTLKKAIEKIGKIDLKNIIAQALHMGDEVHNRNRAGTSLFYRQIAPAVISTAPDPKNAGNVLDFINGNDHFFLNLSMPAAKVSLDAARNIENSSVAVALSRNGTEFGIQLSSTGSRWFTGRALIPDALFFPGYSKEDANPDIGDSAITETAGLGGFAIAASPAIVQFVGGSAKDALNYTRQMYEITVGENNVYQIPYLDFRGTPTGIDVIQVINKNITPFIDTGVAHKDPGVGQVGAGVLSAPVDPFIKAYEGLASELK